MKNERKFIVKKRIFDVPAPALSRACVDVDLALAPEESGDK